MSEHFLPASGSGRASAISTEPSPTLGVYAITGRGGLVARRRRVRAGGILAGVALVALLAASPAPSAGPPGAGGGASAPPLVGQQFAVGVRVLRLVDSGRVVHRRHGGSEPRTLVTYVRYPALGAPGGADVPNALPASPQHPFPLIVFGHGFAVTPALYARLLDDWARAGYVVAAPVFPLGNAHAPGGPDESDIVNQPRDVSFVISRLLAEDAPGAGPLAGLVDPSSIAVAGQSDGGETALAVAYSRRFRDPRVDAALVLSGAKMSGVGGFSFRLHGPALLAVQGTADRINQPHYTYEYFRAARRPKYLLRLLGAQHLPPYTSQEPQLSIVERVTIAFLEAYLKRTPGALAQVLSLGNVPRTAVLTSAP